MTKKYHLQIIIAIVAVAVVATAFWLLNRPEASADAQSTDDAYVQADLTVIAPQVSGVITTVSVDDNQQVQAGAPLFHIDDRELAVAVSNAQAAVASFQAQLDRQQSVIAQARAAVGASGANLKLAERNRQRFANLARDGSGTVQAQQQAEAEWAVQRAAYEHDQAGLRAAEQQVAVLHAEWEKARAAKADADLKLSYASVAAPVAGIVAQRHVRVGGYVHSGEPQLTLVPLDNIYIEANFRETQLARVQVGQPVDITVDALPGVRLKGHVASLGAASGASFSLVPPHNATGNFTKIVQRLPIRIRLEGGQPAAQQLRVGMSVTPTVHVAGTGAKSV
ncbi:membrane fusion protein (multidrug efflux system) [Gibbsiella quercinecans]|uniref:Efflux transporter periplasmic adaptor subunit n=2 Tax=Gibbsiella TaxID=929812 RepID=A0A250B066_9GAMM|nr:HlyD family secretion protein [Gibbsiella quercinecans]ATA19618.1 efflux transporter periplasmic adaptor subunit [Gibbsiella quercinecans]RLM04260.1 efflux transporter periplasmic adaptor subunit [Gibbsiella quercinecans]RLM06462.1 efflux transporter periplasmic adaptor subunit [Gibbsiella quercinecans]TCT83253.1 membrane fusion protein (multidrug efflux system) [Gibbsiella quercinecans]